MLILEHSCHNTFKINSPQKKYLILHICSIFIAVFVDFSGFIFVSIKDYFKYFLSLGFPRMAHKITMYPSEEGLLANVHGSQPEPSPAN